ncbi:hypothetical protein M758_4G274600 [Ceratodon purpureus]|uniref:Uncharacterized protein n=1 Tax=Ceratodon purpureus TaxID=3225 RepID=A0A8T0IFJ7_CERPU|nr:hypothetical protein KC19_4G271200 [Ceratodon purpureus]KAG0621172.1 hypothetical protein M758_4G274600 [Ceratodon purpureus]
MAHGCAILATLYAHIALRAHYSRRRVTVVQPSCPAIQYHITALCHVCHTKDTECPSIISHHLSFHLLSWTGRLFMTQLIRPTSINYFATNQMSNFFTLLYTRNFTAIFSLK